MAMSLWPRFFGPPCISGLITLSTVTVLTMSIIQLIHAAVLALNRIQGRSVSMIHAFRFASISKQLIYRDVDFFSNRISNISNQISNGITYHFFGTAGQFCYRSWHFYPRDAMVLVMRGTDVGLSVSCHKPVLYRNEWRVMAGFYHATQC